MIKRDLYMKKIRPFMDKDVVKVLTGVRRCGKSVMLQLIQEEMMENGVGREQMLQINFETMAVDYVKDVAASYQAIKAFAQGHSGKSYLFLDEIQELSGWEKMINSCMIDFDVDIYITGSNAYMLSGELATYLGGRYVEFKIYPFLYRFSMDEDGSRQYLEDVYSSIILKDIAQRNRVRDIEQLKRLLLYFISNIGNTFSSGSIMKYLKNEQRSISAETLYNYIDHCQIACLLYLVPREDIMGKKVLQFQEKMYIVDHGFREAIYGSNMRDINQVLENIVYIELCRRGYQVFVGKADAMEVGFVAKKNAEKVYVQVTYLLASEETVEREFGVLEKIPDNYPKYVVSMDEIDRGRNGIKHMNIRNFLLCSLL